MKISQERNCRMNKLHTIPAADGFRMPGEFEPHRGCIMIWPKRPGSWNYGAKKAREAFKRVAWAIAVFTARTSPIMIGRLLKETTNASAREIA